MPERHGRNHSSNGNSSSNKHLQQLKLLFFCWGGNEVADHCKSEFIIHNN